MSNTDIIIEQIKKVCGLTVELSVMPKGATDIVFCDEEADKTYFSVERGGNEYVFVFDGSGEQQRITAALAREYAATALAGLASAEPMRDFLSGKGDVPRGVRVGRSDYYVFAIFAKEKSHAVVEYLSAVTGDSDFIVDMGEGITALCKKAESDAYYRSAGEFATILKENISEEIKCKIKIGVGGTSHGVFELPLYYSYATSALISGAEFDPQNDIYSFKEYALVKVLSELPDASKEKYIKTVLDKNYREVLSDEELITAADAFINNSLNISEASRCMYVHRNTLIYRLDKIEKLTGLNVRNFNDAMTFRVACLIYKML